MIGLLPVNNYPKDTPPNPLNTTFDYISFDFVRNYHFAEACGLVEKHGIDLIDAFQILSVKSGPFSSLTGKSQTLFITADKTLSDAGRKEGIETWYCIKDPPIY